MARGVPTFLAGMLPNMVSTQRNDIYDIIIAQLEAYQSNGVNAWQRAETIATRDIVFHSVGDRTLGLDIVPPYFCNGDCDVFLQIRRTGTDIEFSAWQDYSGTSSSGNRHNTVTGSLITLSDTDPIDYFIGVNGHEVAVFLHQEGSFFFAGGGRPRNWVDLGISGIARTTAASAATGSVTFSLDRSIAANIVAGQSVWIQNRTPAVTALASDDTELLVVSAVTATTITLAAVVNTPYEAGSLIGLDPSPVYTATSVDDGDPVLHMTNRFNTSYVGVDSQTADFVSQSQEVDLDGIIPNPADLYFGFRPSIQTTTFTPLGIRGHPQLLGYFGVGTQADKDRMLPGFETAKAYRVFPSMTHTMGFGDWALAIGPGMV